MIPDRTASPDWHPRTDRMWLVVLIAIVFITSLPRAAGPIDMRWDAATYYVLGTSLAQGHGYRLLNEPGEIEAVQYPPLVPLVIAAHQLLLGTSDYVAVGRVLKVTWLLLYVAFAALAYLWLRRYLPPGWAAAGTLLCSFSFQTYFQSGQCSADLPFAVIALFFLYLQEAPSTRRRRVLSALTAIAGFFARTVGVALFAAWILDTLLQRQWRRSAMRALIAAASVLAWLAWVKGVESSPAYKAPAYAYQRAGYQFYNVSYARNMAYVDPFRPEKGLAAPADTLKRIAANLAVLPEALGGAVSSSRDFWRSHGLLANRKLGLDFAYDAPVAAFLIALGVIVTGGLVLLVRMRKWVPVLYVLASIAAVCSTPWPTQMTRYLAPVVPTLVLALLLALDAISRRLVRPGWRTAIWVLAALLIAEQMASYAEAHWRYTIDGRVRDLKRGAGAEVGFRHLFYTRFDAALDEAIDWMAANSAASDRVAVALPQRVYIRTGLKAVMPPLEADPMKGDELLASVPVRYLVIAEKVVPPDFAADYSRNVINHHPSAWRLVHGGGASTVSVFERLPGRQPAASPP